MDKQLDKMQEYDKRMGVPEFKGWQEKEAEHYKQEQAKQCDIHVVVKSLKTKEANNFKQWVKDGYYTQTYLNHYVSYNDASRWSIEELYKKFTNQNKIL